MSDLKDICSIREMCEADLNEVHPIEVDSFSQAWSRQSMLNMLEDSHRTYCVVALIDNKVAAYAFTWIIPEEMHIGNIAVQRDYKRRGIGRYLMEFLIETAQGKSCSVCWLEVRMSNEPARRLYKKMGFSIITTRKGYYSDNKEDALVLAKYL